MNRGASPGSGDCPKEIGGECRQRVRTEGSNVSQLNAQSPSERWDGDCTLSTMLICRFGIAM